MKYIPNSEEIRKEMLDAIGVNSIDDLFSNIPEDIQFKGLLNVTAPKSEFSLKKELSQLAAKTPTEAASFLGAGAYRRFIPSAITPLISRAEFLTSYTPYQPEVSQGSLQVMFEFQSLLSELTGMDVANASMYEGATALAEAIFMASRVKKKQKKVLYSAGIHPEYIETVKTYTIHTDLELVEIPLAENGQTDLSALEKELDDSVLCSAIQVVNFYGVIENQKAHQDLMANSKALSIACVVEMSSLGVIAPPGEFGFDIVVGEAQSLGLPVMFGGPNLGVFACKQKYVRQMPGRLSGKTKDANGEDAFCLTLSTREQHIRREKATSNICSNQSLCALWVTIYLSLMGKHGLRQLASLNMSKTQYALKQIAAINGFNVRFSGTVYNEFVLELPVKSDDFISQMQARDVFAGVPLARFSKEDDQSVLINFTEVNTKEEIDYLIKCLKEVK